MYPTMFSVLYNALWIEDIHASLFRVQMWEWCLMGWNQDKNHYDGHTCVELYTSQHEIFSLTTTLLCFFTDLCRKKNNNKKVNVKSIEICRKRFAQVICILPSLLLWAEKSLRSCPLCPEAWMGWGKADFRGGAGLGWGGARFRRPRQGSLFQLGAFWL